MELQISWTEFKKVLLAKTIYPQYVEHKGNYLLIIVDGSFVLNCEIPLNSSHEDTIDFETNFKALSNPQLKSEVVTQYEKDDKVLKLARAKGIVDPDTCSAEIYLKIPGDFGSGPGRWILGGYGITNDYNPDDYVKCYVEDKDRTIAWMVALSIDPEATEPVSDATIQAMGEIPGVGAAFPAYPTLSSYTDEDQLEENQGWYFWPLANGTTTPSGEVEVNPIGGYGFAPSGFYLKIVYQRPAGITTGSIRLNVDWGKN